MRTGYIAALRTCVALAVGGLCAEESRAQGYDAPRPVSSTQGHQFSGHAPRAYTNSVTVIDSALRQSQSEVPALPEASLPGMAGPGNVTSPTYSTADLNLPAAERTFGGGEPTFSALTGELQQVEEEAEASVTPLMRFLGLEESPWAIYGWIQNSFTANPSFPADRINFGVTPNYRSNDWLGNQYYTVLENALEREGQFNLGGRLDFLFGHDWEFNKMRGVFDGAFASGQFAGIDLPQFYLDMHLPILTEGGVDVKFGRWYTLHGYEVVPAIGRPLLSVPYMFTFGQPFTHWGVMTTWNVNDNLVVYNGIPQGWDTFQIESRAWGYMGGFSWTGFEDKLNLTFIFSRNAHTYNRLFIDQSGLLAPNNFGYSNNNINLFTTVLSYQWSDRLTQVMETDQGLENGIPEFVAGTPENNIDGRWYSFGNWFLYDFTGEDKLTGVWRSEIFWDPNGIRTGANDRYYEMTLGLIYKPCEYLWIRPEARYDWAQFGTPYNAGVSDSQFTYGFDVILLY